MSVIPAIKKYVFIYTFFAVFLQAAETVKIYFIKAEDGESIILIDQYNNNYLIDSGSWPGVYEVYKYITDLEITNIKRMFLTHPHADHIGGVFMLVSAFDIKNIHDNNAVISDDGFDSFYSAYRKKIRNNRNYRPVYSPETFSNGNFSLSVLHPERDNFSGNWNQDSLCLLLKFGSFRALFTADINFESEKKLLQNSNIKNIQLLKVAHHGGNDTTSSEFLEYTRPQAAVICVSKNDWRGFPHLLVLERLKKIKAEVYTTMSSSILIQAAPDGNFIVREASYPAGCPKP